MKAENWKFHDEVVHYANLFSCELHDAPCRKASTFYVIFSKKLLYEKTSKMNHLCANSVIKVSESRKSEIT